MVNLTFQRRCNYILKRYPQADEVHLLEMLGKLVMKSKKMGFSSTDNYLKNIPPGCSRVFELPSDSDYYYECKRVKK